VSEAKIIQIMGNKNCKLTFRATTSQEYGAMTLTLYITLMSTHHPTEE
jgi:hypothetical protein